LAAIELALRNGANAIELDVHATSDRHIVVCHDDTVDATTNGHGEIAALTLAQVRELDNAYWFIPGATVTPGRPDVEYVQRGRAPKDRSYGVATLEEVVERFPGILLNLDIKRIAPDVEPYEELLADELRRLERTSSVMVASFHDAALEKFRLAAPDVATSAATNETATFFFSMLEGAPVIPPVSAFQVPATFGEITVVDERFVATAHAHDIAVHVWTINDEEEMNRLVDLGVDGVVSDRPALLAEVLRTRGVAWDGAW
jgi:glycerophosphoryl diester phosphodiesterase